MAIMPNSAKPKKYSPIFSARFSVLIFLALKEKKENKHEKIRLKAMPEVNSSITLLDA